jgi:hypothetical protein
MIVNVDFQEILGNAQSRAEQMVNNGLYSRFNLNYKQRIDKALLGCMGEIAFEAYLNQIGIPYQLDTSDFKETNTDQFDFLIYGNKLDVKVAKKSTPRPPTDGWTYGYPAEQNPTTKDFVVVGWVDFQLQQIGFYGWITGSQIAQLPIVEQNTFAGYQYLTPNHEFTWGAMNKDFTALFDFLRNNIRKLE